ncbi:hypothetical protein [Dryocola sp. LX212]
MGWSLPDVPEKERAPTWSPWICESSDDKSFLEKLRWMADWQLSDSYFRTGVHPKYTRPAEVCAESAGGISPEEMAEIREMEARSRY